MSKLTAFLLLIFMLASLAMAQDMENSKIAISLSDLATPPASDISHIVKAFRETIINSLSQFPNVIIHPTETVLEEYTKNPEILLTADKVKLLRIKRETGLDGLIFGSLEEKENKLMLTIHLVDFSSGRIFFSDTFEDSFGSSLLTKVEDKITAYVNSLMIYYNRTLTVISDPDGAEVWINGQEAGVTPVNNFIVKDRQVQIQIKKQGYVPYETSIELDTGQKVLVNAQLYKYSLTVKSQPLQANVLVNGQVVGITPIDDLVLEKPEFTVDVIMKGYKPFSQSLSLDPGQKAYIYAELYDVLADRILKRDSLWRIDYHEVGFLQNLGFQNMKEIDVESFSISNFQYCAKFGRFSAGFGTGFGILKASQNFDTFIGAGEGYEAFDIDIVKGKLFARYNIFEIANMLGLYLGASTGFMSVNSKNYDAQTDLVKLRKVNPLIGGEFGVDFYVLSPFKLTIMGGYDYGGEIEYAKKKATYWGESEYKREILKLQPFYVGVSIMLSFRAF
ncbi:MAG: hypothetical protein QG641_2419 [Candidatus Poribacteria bacterium]|nr:hypothetical protein [Candidatus Poribacteria bacterium]